MKNVRPYIALRTPMSRTRPARNANSSISRVPRAEQLHEQRAGHVEALGHLRVHGRVEVHALAGDRLQAPADPLGRDDEQRQQHEGDEREPPVEQQHRDRAW